MPAKEPFDVTIWAAVRAGRRVTFAPAGPDESADQGSRRGVPANWLLELTPDPARICSVPIHIDHAVIIGSLQWAFVTFEYDVLFTNCDFLDRVDLQCATFKRRAGFERCAFHGPVSFHAAHALFDLNLRAAHFLDAPASPADRSDHTSDFSDLSVDGSLLAQGVTYRDVSFDRLRVGKNALFGPAWVGEKACPARFRGRARFRDASIQVNAVFNGACFEETAEFQRLSVQGNAVFSAPREVDRERPIAEVLPVTFVKDLSFEEARIGGSAIFDGVSIGGAAVFRALQVGGQTMARIATVGGGASAPVFTGDVTFWRAQLSGNVEFQGAAFGGKAIFSLARFGGDVRFSAGSVNGPGGTVVAPSRFARDVEFRDVRVSGTADFGGTQFDANAAFDRMHVAGRLRFGYGDLPDATLRSTRVGGTVSFIDATVQGIASFEGLQLHGEANFNRFRVASNLFFRTRIQKGQVSRTQLAGATTFLEARVEGSVDFSGVEFGDATFTRLRVGGDAFWTAAIDPAVTVPASDAEIVRTRFTGKAEFDAMRIEGSARFGGAEFCSALQPADDSKPTPARFYAMWVGRDVTFSPFARGTVVIPTQFERPTNFTRLFVGGNADFFGTQFAGDASFESIHVQGHARFRAFEPLNSPASKLTPVFKQHARFWGAMIDGAAEFNECRFESTSNFENLAVLGGLVFRGATFTGHVTLAAARLRTLTLGFGQDAATFLGTIDLKGCTYDTLEGSWKMVVAKIQPFDRQPYNQLERVLRLGGLDREAGEVYLSRRKHQWAREWSEVVDRRSGIWRDLSRRLAAVPRVLFDGLQWGVFRYGVRPFRLLVGTVLIVLLGAWVFALPNAVADKDTVSQSAPSSTNMERAAIDRPTSRDYAIAPLSTAEAFGYSVRLFIPIVELPVGARWVPSPTRRIGTTRMTIETYASLHRLAGAVLVPLGLAVLTGLLVRRDKGASPGA